MLLPLIQNTHVYQRALNATTVKPYSALKLEHVVDTIGQALKHVHGQGFFIEYTRHGPEHTAELVNSLDWIIEDNQKSNLRDADYLFLLLACLLHDLGMLTTQEEFQKRDLKSLAHFEGSLSTFDRGREFLAAIPPKYPYREELIFEEFIRNHHAARIRSALLRDNASDIGDVSKIADLLKGVFHDFDQKCLGDLALICESHHKDDLDDLKKYQIKSVHGPSSEAQINVQAVAILLRIADVLQIGTGRTPSVDFSIISPSNPISHLHWMKEMGVRRVEGETVPAKAPDERDAHVIKIYGRFEEAEPFFALQNHLKFAGSELLRCVKWSSNSKSGAQHYQFLWDRIDGTEIETYGFEREQFSFQIDREKILNLLVGHTLYNDTRVVLRELVQNSVDAVRLEKHKKDSATYSPKISVELEPEERILVIADNGTGMTAATIKSHLLTVGSSYYSTEDFGKAFPGFTAISRFGIGILTAFMIADEIEITTSHPDEPKARRININGPSGTYLIKLVEKSQLPSSFIDKEHGTRIELNLRPQSREIDLSAELSHWFAFPDCELTARVGQQERKTIGFDHPVDFLTEVMNAVNTQQNGAMSFRDYEVLRCDVPGMFDGAYLVRRSRYSKRAYIARTDEFNRRRQAEDGELTVRECGVFLQGVRVLGGSPGFQSEGPVAVINGVGPRVPKTNVARSGIEQGPEYQAFLKALYGIYLAHSRKEVDAWSLETGNTSLTTRGRKLSNLVLNLSSNTIAVDQKIFQQQIDDEKRIVVEVMGERKLISRTELLDLEEFDTIESKFMRTAEDLIENLSATKSLDDIITSLELPTIDVLSDTILTEAGGNLDERALARVKIGRLNFDEASLQLTINWRKVEDGQDSDLRRLKPDMKRSTNGSRRSIILVASEAIGNDCNWSEDTILVCEYGCFVHPKNSQIELLERLLTEDQSNDEPPEFKLAFTHAILQLWPHDQYEHTRSLEEIAAAYGRGDAEALLTALKEHVAPFRSMRAIRVGKDEQLWF
ncbi:hypothetical protein AZF01_07525 [Martelella sp. AD-3]|nr:hypothetical protein AZF01_07525 [Martelella sp. AD-3]